MNKAVFNWTAKHVDKLRPFGKVLEVGSLDINGSVRPLFDGAEEYIGTDMQEGKGVDRVINSHDLVDHFEKDRFDIVICTEVLEHDQFFWVTLQGIDWVLKRDGFLIITAPTFYFPVIPGRMNLCT